MTDFIPHILTLVFAIYLVERIRSGLLKAKGNQNSEVDNKFEADFKKLKTDVNALKLQAAFELRK